MKKQFALFTYQRFYPGGGMNDFAGSFSDLQSTLDKAEEKRWRGHMNIAFLSDEGLEYILYRARGCYQNERMRGVFYDTGWVWVQE